MARAYSKLLYAAVVPVGTGSVQSPPAGFTWVIRSVSVVQTAGTNVVTQLRLSPDALVVFNFFPTAPSNGQTWDLRLVVPVGRGFYFTTGVNSAQVTVSGYELATT